MKKFFKNRLIKYLPILLAVIIISPFLFTKANVTIAPFDKITISADDVDGSDWLSLTEIAISEGNAGEIATGTHTFTLPNGWEFDTNRFADIGSSGGGLSFPAKVKPNTGSLSITINNLSTTKDTLYINNLFVRPTDTAKSTGKLTHSGANIAGVDENTSFGELEITSGVVSKLIIETQPDNTEYGSSVTVEVKTADQFNNSSINGLGASRIVSVALQGETGTLNGTLSMDIGTEESNGELTFDDLIIKPVGEDYQLVLSSDSIDEVTSEEFKITEKPITVTATIDNKVYDGTTDATISGFNLASQIIPGDNVEINAEGIATFDNANVEDNKVVNINDTSYQGADVDNYIITTEASNANITKKGLTISGSFIANNKPYDGDASATINDSFLTLVGVVDPEDVNLDTITLEFTDKNAGEGKTVSIANATLKGENKDNYTVITNDAPTTTANISPLLLTIGVPDLGGKTKTYDGDDKAEVTKGALDGVIGEDEVKVSATATYDNKNVGTEKTIIVTYTLSGDDSSNYLVPVSNTADDGAIEALSITVTATIDNKVYDGTQNATISGFNLASQIIPGDNVEINAEGIATFDNANVEDNKVVNINDTSYQGVDVDNYTITTEASNANITEATPTITWNPFIVSAGTELKDNEIVAQADGVNGEVEITGTFSYTDTTNYKNEVGDYEIKLTFTSTNSNYSSKDATTTVTVIPASIYKFEISADPINLSVGDSSTITVVGKDQYDNTVNDPSPVVLTLDNSGELGDTTLTLNEGQANTTLTKENAGSVNVTASYGSVIPSSVKVTFNIDTTPPVISDLNVSTTKNTASITFKSNENGTARLAYSTGLDTPISTDYITITADDKASINLSGLVCGTNYDYILYVYDENSNLSTESGDFNTSACDPIIGPSEPSVISVEKIQKDFLPNNNYDNGWEWRLLVNLPEGESDLALRLSNWTSGSNTLASANNVRYFLENNQGEVKTIDLANVYGESLTAVDLDPNTPGIQAYLIIQVKIPETTPAGSYSSSYQIKSETPNGDK